MVYKLQLKAQHIIIIVIISIIVIIIVIIVIIIITIIGIIIIIIIFVTIIIIIIININISFLVDIKSTCNKFRHNFNDRINLMCNCRPATETTIHYLLRSRLYSVSRAELLNGVYKLDSTLQNLSAE